MMNAISDIMNLDSAPMSQVQSAPTGDEFAQMLREAGNHDDQAREQAEKLIGIALFLPLFKQIGKNPFRTDLMHGGRGEEAFTQQLHMNLADRMGRRMGGDLVDAVVDRLHGRKVDVNG